MPSRIYFGNYYYLHQIEYYYLRGMRMNKKIYVGQLINEGDSNNDLYLDKYGKSLDLIIQQDSEKYGKYLMVKYWISNEKLPESKLDEKFMDTYYNIEENDNISYFEISEYLWKGESKWCKHDLIGELTTYAGKYCTLEIDYSKEPQTHDKSYF